MTITIDLGPQVLAALAREAAACGRSVETHAAHVLEDAVQLRADRARDTVADGIEIDDRPVIVTTLAIDQTRHATRRRYTADSTRWRRAAGSTRWRCDCSSCR